MKQVLRNSGVCAIIVLICATVITTVIRSANATATYTSSNATVTFPTVGSTFNVNQIFPISSNHTISFSRTVDSPDHGDRVGAIVKNGTTQGGVDTLVSGTGASHSWGAGTSGTWTYTNNGLSGTTSLGTVGSAAVWAKTNYTINNGTEQLGTYNSVTITIQ
jgi:hypothetical protein